MIYIKRSELARIKKQYPDYVCKDASGRWYSFEGCFTGDFSRGCTLIFEHIHFEIVEG